METRIFHIILSEPRHDGATPPIAVEGVRRSHPDWAIRVWDPRDVDGFFLRDEIRRTGPQTIAAVMMYEILCRHGGVCLHPELMLLRPIDPLLRNATTVLLGDGLGRVSTRLMASVPSHPIFWAAVRELPGMRRLYQSDAYGAGEQMLSHLVNTRFGQALVIPEAAVIGKRKKLGQGKWTISAASCGVMLSAGYDELAGFVEPAGWREDASPFAIPQLSGVNGR